MMALVVRKEVQNERNFENGFRCAGSKCAKRESPKIGALKFHGRLEYKTSTLSLALCHRSCFFISSAIDH
jgi:hypothetical protein